MWGLQKPSRGGKILATGYLCNVCAQGLPKGDRKRSLCNVYVRGSLLKLQYRKFFWQDLGKRSHGKISAQISARGLLARPPGQDLEKGSFGKIFAQISVRGVSARPPGQQLYKSTRTLCEPAQSKCKSPCHKSHFIQTVTARIQWPRLNPERRHTYTHTKKKMCESTQSKCTSTSHKSHSAVKFAGKMPQPRWAQNAETVFVRACATETHVKISPEPLLTATSTKNDAAQNPAADFARACAVGTQVKISQTLLYTEI